MTLRTRRDLSIPLDKRYAAFLKGKSVALVGPSPSIKGTGKGAFIDSHDIVVRLNKAIPVPLALTTDIGAKTDILYNCLKPGSNAGGDINPKLWAKKGVKYVSSPYPKIMFAKHDILKFVKLNKGLLDFHIFPREFYARLRNELNTRPNTGFLAIIDLLLYDIKCLYVTGITFGIDGYYKEYSNVTMKQFIKMADGKNHKQQPQFLYIKNKIFNKDKRFKPDVVLKDILVNRKKVRAGSK